MPAPTNGTCATAIDLAGLTPYSVTLDTTLASTDTEVTPSCPGGSQDKAVWWTITVTSPRLIAVNTHGTDYDNNISAWSGSCGSLTQISCAHTPYDGLKGIYTTFFAAANTRYAILITDASGLDAGGSLVLSIQAQNLADSLITGVNPISPATGSIYAYSPTDGSEVGVDDSYGETIGYLSLDPSTNHIFGTNDTDGLVEFGNTLGFLDTHAIASKPSGNYDFGANWFTPTRQLYVLFNGFSGAPDQGHQSFQRLNPDTYALIQAWDDFDVDPSNAWSINFLGLNAVTGVLYYSINGGAALGQNQIRTLNLTTSATAVFATYGTWSGGVNPTGWRFEAQCGVVLSNNRLLVLAEHETTGTIDAASLLIYNTTTGTLVNDFPLTFTAAIRGICVIESTNRAYVIGSAFLECYELAGGTRVFTTALTPSVAHVTLLLSDAPAVPPLPPTGHGFDANGVPVGPFTPIPIRRVRQAPILNDGNLWQFCPLFQLDAQVGVGLTTGQGETPTVFLEISRDGGMTFGPPRPMSAGRLGEYRKRIQWTRNGRARNFVFRVYVSDPVTWNLLGAYLDLQEGTS